MKSSQLWNQRSTFTLTYHLIPEIRKFSFLYFGKVPELIKSQYLTVIPNTLVVSNRNGERKLPIGNNVVGKECVWILYIYTYCCCILYIWVLVSLKGFSSESLWVTRFIVPSLLLKVWFMLLGSLFEGSHSLHSWKSTILLHHKSNWNQSHVAIWMIE